MLTFTRIAFQNHFQGSTMTNSKICVTHQRSVAATPRPAPGNERDGVFPGDWAPVRKK